MNLITTRWILARRRKGERALIAPWEITSDLENNPIVSLACPRADFDGALIQILIGLLQTTMAPATAREWGERFDAPPSPDELRDAFAPLEPCFGLMADGPRFFQDLELDESIGKRDGVEKLLIDAPGANTLAQGIDHFVKAGRVDALCLPCAASALASLQINAPSGGQGHRTGIRGGGPLTTLVVPEESEDGKTSLWHSLWLNVLDRRAFGNGDPLAHQEAIFPWLSPTRTSEGGAGTTLNDVHPLQVYWAMPRRIRLEPPDPAAPTVTCDLCNAPEGPRVRSYLTKNLGTNYTGPWHHPLSPYRYGKDGALIAFKGSSQGLSYRDWVGLVVPSDDERERPARVVQVFLNERRRSRRAGGLHRYRLWAFGYDMDKMKARGWVEDRMPLEEPPEGADDVFSHSVRQLVKGADWAAWALETAVRSVLSGHSKKAQAPPEARKRFWEETQPAFLSRIQAIREALASDEGDLDPIKRRWMSTLARSAGGIFEDLTGSGYFQGLDPAEVAAGWNQLNRTIYGRRMRTHLGLPPDPPPKGKGVSAGAAAELQEETS